MHLSKRNNGGILIEFTFSIPVCISLLFFVNDHYRFYELKSKIRTSAYLAASMVQQLGNTRTDKQLTKSDLLRVSYASCLNLFHTNSMFAPYPFGIYFLAHYYFVKKNDDGNYQYQRVWITTGRGSATTKLFDGMNSGINSLTMTSAQVEAIDPDLICNNIGEERLLIKCWYGVVNGGKDFKKSQLGLFILEPTFGDKGNFSYSLVITPKPGLFPVKN